MAEEPQPANPGPQPSAAERQREEAALSNLSSQNMTSDDAEGGAAGTATDTAALGAAVSNLSIDGGVGAGASKTGGANSSLGPKATSGVGAGGVPKKEAKKIKIDPGDVAFLVQELEVGKKKANEMLVAAGGDRSAAVRTFVEPVKI